jgi:hypothetical protein
LLINACHCFAVLLIRDLLLKRDHLKVLQMISLGVVGRTLTYKVVTTMRKDQGAGAGSNIYALNIEEFESGPKKPFVFMENNKIFFGLCEHY